MIRLKTKRKQPSETEVDSFEMHIYTGCSGEQNRNSSNAIVNLNCATGLKITSRKWENRKFWLLCKQTKFLDTIFNNNCLLCFYLHFITVYRGFHLLREFFFISLRLVLNSLLSISASYEHSLISYQL